MESIFIVALIGMSALLLVPLAGTAQPSKQARTAVLVVDVQGDFTTWKKGALAVEGADKAYVEMVGDITRRLHQKGHLIFASQDWHPPDHISFFTNHPDAAPFDTVMVHDRRQILWPPHCIQGSENAGILIGGAHIEAVVQKGRDPRYDSYSAFKDDGGKATGLDRILKDCGIDHLVLYGLATDYCVRATVQDALQAGYRVTLVTDLCRGVAPGTTAEALREMASWGVRMVTAADFDSI